MGLTNKIGVMIDSFRLGVRGGLQKAKELGADGVQIYAVNGEMDPSNLSASARKDLRQYIEELGLDISALCGDLGGHGFQDKTANQAKIEKSKRILDLAVELGTSIVTTHIGLVPDDTQSEIYEEMQRACQELGTYAKSMNAFFAIETGPETSRHLKEFLDTLGGNGVSVNFDPANMVMVTGDDPAQGVYTLKEYIVHTHVKDGIRLRAVDPKKVYGLLGYEPLAQEQIAAVVETGEPFREVPLGDGNVDFHAYFAALQNIGYKGYLTIEREVGDQPEVDVSNAIQFIRKYR